MESEVNPKGCTSLLLSMKIPKRFEILRGITVRAVVNFCESFASHE